MKKTDKKIFLLQNGFVIDHKTRYNNIVIIDNNRNGTKMYFDDLDSAYEAIKRWYLPTKKPQTGAL